MTRPVARLPDSARWIWVSMDHATFAVAVRGGKVVAAPPIARWAVGKDERVAAATWRELGAVFRELPVPCRAWVELPGGTGWGDTRVAIGQLEDLDYAVAEIRGASSSLLRLSGSPLERAELLRVPGQR
jgi:hypothetical protein